MVIFERETYKKTAKIQLKGNYGPAVLVVFINLLITLGLSGLTASENSFFGLLNLLAMGVLILAVTTFFFKYTRKAADEKITFSVFLSALSEWLTGIASYLWYLLWSVLWTLLLVVPGIIKMLAYSQLFYILADNPDIPVRKALKMSIAMTKGYKSDLFVMGLSFLGWYLLSVLTCGILLLWLTPYVTVSFANAYVFLKEEALRSGALTAADFETPARSGESVHG